MRNVLGTNTCIDIYRLRHLPLESMLYRLQQVGWLVWLVVLGIYVALAVFQPYRDLEAGDNQSLKFKWRDRESNPGPLAPQAKSLTTRPPPQVKEISKCWLVVSDSTRSHLYKYLNHIRV